MDNIRPCHASLGYTEFMLEWLDFRRSAQRQNRIILAFIAALFVLLRHCHGFDVILGLFLAYPLSTSWVSQFQPMKQKSKLLKKHFATRIFHDYINDVHPRLVPFLLPIWHMTVTGSDYLNLAAAVERYLATDRGFRADKKSRHHLGCSTFSTKMYIGKILIMTVLFNVPAFFELRTNINPEGQLEVFETSLRTHKVYTQMYRLMAEFLIFKASPWFAFFILWLSLSRRIR